MEEAFTAFSKFGSPKSEGIYMTLSNSDKWMKQAGVIDGKKITTVDTAICFNKFRSKALAFHDFMSYVEQLAIDKKVQPQTLIDKLMHCKYPGAATGATVLVKNDAVNRLTDPSKYTGSHKARFDKDGKGKGIEGREDVADTSGYVAAFNRANTYDKTH